MSTAQLETELFYRRFINQTPVVLTEYLRGVVSRRGFPFSTVLVVFLPQLWALLVSDLQRGKCSDGGSVGGVSPDV